jgi:hypothetical protein
MKLRYSVTFVTLFAACSPEGGEGPVYQGDIQHIVDENCATCHVQGGIAPIPLTTFEEVYEARSLVASSVDLGTMPPWPPNNDCNDYQYDRSLLPEERERLLKWANGEAREGDSTDGSGPVPPESLETDVVLNLPEPYAPQTQPDDYRCHLVEWPSEGTQYITGYEVHPDQAQIVHHVIAFGVPPDQAEAFRGYDEADEGPGYSCFGSPYPSEGEFDIGGFVDTQWLASWAPGGMGREFPAGTGIKIEPGSLVVIQVHYNSIDDEPVSDDSSMSFQTSETVEREAVVIPYTNPLWVLGS